ncbi:hypothetical protein ACQPXS_46635 (plasmid) [Streptomyces sp. CA-142005]|uniref:hypothetical protein n=1 Tax=Streptomyces sp. CA-142005 TaxID=3240052 RepID=UPI003D8F3D7A
MDAVLPRFVGQLVAQSRDANHIPDITVLAATGWLSPLASRVLPLLDTGTYRSEGSFLVHGYAYLPLQTPDDFTVYLRVSETRAMKPWRVHAPAAVLTMVGATTLEMYRDSKDAQGGRPQYARTFGAGEFFTAHPGTLCATRGTASTVQILVTTEPVAEREGPLSGEAYASFARRARRYLERASLAPAGGPC